MVQIYVSSDYLRGFYDYWEGRLTKSGEELRKQLEKKADRVFEKLDMSTLKTKQDYIDRLQTISYADPRKQNAFRNWALRNYANAREWFYDKFVRPKILERAKTSKLRLRSGIRIKGFRLDERSYIQWISYKRPDGKVIEFAQRRHLKTGKIMPYKHLI